MLRINQLRASAPGCKYNFANEFHRTRRKGLNTKYIQVTNMEPKDKIIIIQYTTICDLKKQIQALKEQISLIKQSKPVSTIVI